MLGVSLGTFVRALAAVPSRALGEGDTRASGTGMMRIASVAKPCTSGSRADELLQNPGLFLVGALSHDLA